MLAAELLRGQEIRFYGGPPLAERENLLLSAGYLDESWLESEDGPIAPPARSIFGGDTLTHRDFLGALMGCGVKRETVDIYVAEGALRLSRYARGFAVSAAKLLAVRRPHEGKLHVEQIALTDVSVPEQKTKMVRDTVPLCGSTALLSSGFSIPAAARPPDSISAGKCEL